MNIRKLFVLAVMATTGGLTALGQMQSSTGSQVVVSDAPSRDFFSRYFYTDSGDTYTCVTSAIQAAQYTAALTSTTGGTTTTLTFSGGHGWHADSSPKVTISGALTTWLTANATWKATYVSATAVTIALNSSAFGAVSGTLVVKAHAPRLNQPVWAVSRYRPAGANPSSSMWSSDGWTAVCSDFLTLGYQ